MVSQTLELKTNSFGCWPTKNKAVADVSWALGEGVEHRSYRTELGSATTVVSDDDDERERERELEAKKFFSCLVT